MLEQLTVFDYAVAAIVGFAAIGGLARGFVGEVVSLLAWVAGVLAVRVLHVQTKTYVGGWIDNEAGAAAVALLGLFVGSFLAVRLIGGALSRKTRASVIGPVDRILGLGFGAAKGVVAATLMFLLVVMGIETVFPGQPQPDWMAQAKSTPTLVIASRLLVDFVDEARRIDGDLAGGDPHAGLGLPGFGGGADEADGYRGEDRSALDKLLDEQEKQIPSTPI
ncbi:MAG: CvpA family protein [Polymorphobacter sp.]|uniref:CvpA family protein n=1 Tax=Polymorphobacter sp. TaxID=1909290 RepID=UPI003A887347